MAHWHAAVSGGSLEGTPRKAVAHWKARRGKRWLMGAMYVCVRTCRAGHEGSSVPDSKEVDALLLHSELDVSEFFAQPG